MALFNNFSELQGFLAFFWQIYWLLVQVDIADNSGDDSWKQRVQLIPSIFPENSEEFSPWRRKLGCKKKLLELFISVYRYCFRFPWFLCYAKWINLDKQLWAVMNKLVSPEKLFHWIKSRKYTRCELRYFASFTEMHAYVLVLVRR